MLYLLDANVLITAHNTYYPIHVVPEFWDWLIYKASNNQIKVPLEMFEEIITGAKKDDLKTWIEKPDTKKALLLNEEVDRVLVSQVFDKGYGPDVTETEAEQIGRDPFLIAYGLADVKNRCVVTVEVSALGKKREKRKIPDVCTDFSVQSCNPFVLYHLLEFSTRWHLGLTLP